MSTSRSIYKKKSFYVENQGGIHRFVQYSIITCFFARSGFHCGRMKSGLRHSRQGGDAEAETVHTEGASEITKYEEEHNRRKKALHDEVQKSLLESGFGEAADLRPLFTGEFAEVQGVGDTTPNVSHVHWKSLHCAEDVQLRRSTRNITKGDVNTGLTVVVREQEKRVRDTSVTPISSKLTHSTFCHVGYYQSVCCF